MGLIPAHAGKTSRRRGLLSTWRAHPRSRGENRSRRDAALPGAGSSPLTRGKPLPKPSPKPTPGLIPAHAGKTGASRLPEPASRAHPRSRGENVDTAVRRENELGSSPLTRGKPQRVVHERDRLGLIPAHAGKTTTRKRGTPVEWAHPRSRGENAPMATTARPMGGSSPLTRGKRHRRN